MFRSHGASATRPCHSSAPTIVPQDLKIACRPTVTQCQETQKRLAARLGRDVAHIGGYYSRGGGATPLALPELLEVLLTDIRPGLGTSQRGEDCSPLSIGTPAT